MRTETPERTRVVVDASAVVELLHDPSSVREALEGRRLTAPALVFPEVASVLRRFEFGGAMTADEASELFQAMLALPFDIVDWRPCAERVWRLRHTATPYDATYVALAEMLGVPLVTADRRLAHAPGIRCEVVVL